LLAFRHYTKKSWNALVNENLFFQFIREKSPVTIPIVAIETLLRLYIVSFVALIILMLVSPSMLPVPSVLFRICLMFAIFFAAKTAIAFFLAILTDKVDYFKVQNLNNIIVTSNASWGLIPLIMVVMYLSMPLREYGIYAVLLAFGVTVASLVYRSVRVVSKTGIPIDVQFFLYLCAFEILPYLFVVKYFGTNLV